MREALRRLAVLSMPVCGSDESEDPMAQDDDEDLPELNISAEKIEYIIIKARELDAKVEPIEDDPGSNPADDGESEILEDYDGDPTAEELRAVIDTLNEDEVIELIALAWIGRGDFDRSDWEEAKALAEERHGRRSFSYLAGMPALGDYLEEGLAAIGHSGDAETEANHL
jgi:hypothetical protein